MKEPPPRRSKRAENREKAKAIITTLIPAYVAGEITIEDIKKQAHAGYPLIMSVFNENGVAVWATGQHPKMRTNFVCVVPYCDMPAVARGVCAKHYEREKRGDLLGREQSDALWEWIEREAQSMKERYVDDHILYPGNTSKKTGHARLGSKVVHRIIWEKVYGSLDEDLVLDHDPFCSKHCVNIYHLTPMTASEHSIIENERRSDRWIPAGLSRKEAQTLHDRVRAVASPKRQQTFERYNGACYYCSLPIEPDQPWDQDHILPIWAGGTNHDANLAPIHKSRCHAAKEVQCRAFLLPCLRVDLRSKADKAAERVEAIRALLPQYIDGELTIEDIKKSVRTSHETIKLVFAEEGVSVWNTHSHPATKLKRRSKRNKPTREDKRQATIERILELVPLYLAGEITINDIRAKANAGHAAITKVFEEYDIPKWTRNEHPKRKTKELDETPTTTTTTTKL